MYGRYQRKADKQAIAEYFQLGIVEDFPLEAAPSYNVAPTTMQPIIVNNRDTGERELRIMRWGLVPSWCWDIKKLGLSTINARSEDLSQKQMWRKAVATHRCLVPADGFYEWKKTDDGTKQPYSFQLKNGEPFAFAGIWGALASTGWFVGVGFFLHHHYRTERTRRHGSQSNASDSEDFRL